MEEEHDDEEVVWEYRSLCERLCLLSRSLTVTTADTHRLASVITHAVDFGVDKVTNYSYIILYSDWLIKEVMINLIH